MYKDRKTWNNNPPRDIHRYIRGYFKLIENFVDDIEPAHTALYMWILNRNNSLFWKPVIEVSTSEAMASLGMKCPKWYRRIRKDLIEWGLIKVVRRSTNQNRPIALSLPYPDERSVNRDLDDSEEHNFGRMISRQSREAYSELDHYRNNVCDEDTIPMEPI